MNEQFWLAKTCPVCEQGRLFVMENLTDNKLYLHCEECELGWDNPEAVELVGGFLAINPEFEERLANKETIEKFGWTKYELKSL